jgi:hypothetical protein
MSLNETYVFKNPIRRNNSPLHEITVRPPCLRDLKALDGITGDSARAAKMIELLTGLTEREAELIQLEDVAGLGALVARFFDALPGGKTP